MLILLRRFLVLAALMFWLGGFTFYAAVVVPIGQEVLGSHLEQGLITRQVTNYMNLASGVAVLLLGWDVAAARDPSAGRRRARWLSWVGVLAFLALLVWLHPRLDALLDLDEVRLLDAKRFRTLHRWYLWVSTFQWTCGLVYCVLSLQAWRVEDRDRKSAASA
jgi:hypothetical protein